MRSRPCNAGIIPAYAGSTSRRCYQSTQGGSSPHARGALGPAREGRVQRGIIPACAESTSQASSCRAVCRDHPRMRGEHMADAYKGLHIKGSSPHARGARRIVVKPSRDSGIIPACAGSTFKGELCQRATRDHPRMRGEHPQHSTHPPPPGRDHPRMRGEHPGSPRARARPPGSSPHARGTLRRLVVQADLAGIIPACAGSTPVTFRPRTRARDHPRMRGEHTAAPQSSQPAQGSSPHARGALMRRDSTL